MIDCCNTSSISPIVVPDSYLTWTAPSSPSSAIRRKPQSDTNPRYRGKRSYNPLLCMETNSTYFWDAELRAGNAGTWDGTPELLDTCFANVPPDVREIRLRADSGFGFDPVLQALEKESVDYVVVARM